MSICPQQLTPPAKVPLFCLISKIWARREPMSFLIWMRGQPHKRTLITSHQPSQVPSCRHIQIQSRKEMVIWVLIIFHDRNSECAKNGCYVIFQFCCLFVTETHITRAQHAFYIHCQFDMSLLSYPHMNALHS